MVVPAVLLHPAGVLTLGIGTLHPRAEASRLMPEVLSLRVAALQLVPAVRSLRAATH